MATRARVERDFYPTPDKLIRAYLAQNPNLFDLDDTILEPCIGEGAIANPLRGMGYRVGGTDITDGIEFDASKPEYWTERHPDWVFTNPPFNLATPIIEHALKQAQKGVIMLLRSSYLEPCKDRRHLLNKQVAQVTFCNPRPKFRIDTKGSDSATAVFIVWRKQPTECVKISYLIDWHISP
jgi:hypothetical protein